MSTPTQKTATVVFTEEEAKVTLNLFDAAVKSLGLNAAEAAVYLAKKINAALKENVVQQLPSNGN